MIEDTAKKSRLAEFPNWLGKYNLPLLSLSLIGGLILIFFAFRVTEFYSVWAYRRLEVQSVLGNFGEVTAVIRFSQPKGIDELQNIQVPGRLWMVYFGQGGFAGIEDPSASLAGFLKYSIEFDIASGSEPEGARRMALLGFKLTAKPKEIIKLVDSIPGTEVRFLDKVAENTLELRPKGKEAPWTPGK